MQGLLFPVFVLCCVVLVQVMSFFVDFLEA